MISFLDGEIMYADIDDLSFDVPVIEARVRNLDSNSERALFPVSAIRQVVVGEVAQAPAASVLDTWERAVFRFMDGQVLRSHIAPAPVLGRHGGIWQCVEPGGTEVRCLAIPYAALKAVFEVREWDGRSMAQRAGGDDAAADAERLARMLSERTDRPVPARDERGLLTRIRRAERAQ